MTDQHTYSAADMANRVVRFDDLKHTGTPLMFIDSILPNHWCMNYAVIGTAGSDPGAAANRAIAAPHAFQVRMGWAPPGNGPAWHTHDYVELIVILDGEWRFAWGYSEDRARPDGEFILGKWDMISARPACGGASMSSAMGSGGSWRLPSRTRGVTAEIRAGRRLSSTWRGPPVFTPTTPAGSSRPRTTLM